MRIRLLLALGTLGLLALSGIGLWSLRSQMLEDRQERASKAPGFDPLGCPRRHDEGRGGRMRGWTENFLRGPPIGKVWRRRRSETTFLLTTMMALQKPTPIPRGWGGNRINVVYANGVKVIKEFIDIARSPAGFGFIEYPIEKGAGGPLTPKLSLIQNVPEVGGLVGVGAYIDDADADWYRQLFMEGAMLAAVLAAIGAAGFSNRANASGCDVRFGAPACGCDRPPERHASEFGAS